MFQKKEVVIDSGRARAGWSSFTSLPERAPFSPLPSLFGILQCEVPRGHNFLSHLAAAPNLDWSGMEGHVGLFPAQAEARLPRTFSCPGAGDTRGWSPGEPRPPRPSGSPLISELQRFALCA